MSDFGLALLMNFLPLFFCFFAGQVTEVYFALRTDLIFNDRIDGLIRKGSMIFVEHFVEGLVTGL